MPSAFFPGGEIPHHSQPWFAQGFLRTADAISPVIGRVGAC
jgi:hypothetical protein